MSHTFLKTDKFRLVLKENKKKNLEKKKKKKKKKKNLGKT